MKIEINGQNFDLSQTSKTFLEKYLERMRRFLKDNDIEDDVYDDIEERIAEKFMENLFDVKGKKITDKVVIDIINEIWEPSEILEELIDNDFETKKEQKKKTSSFKEHFEVSDNPLTRNSEKWILFWVCYWIADKYNLDPLWIRLAFVFGTLLRWTTIILYIVLIFLLPNETSAKKKDKWIIDEIEDLKDNFVSDIKEVTKKREIEKYMSKFNFKKSGNNANLENDIEYEKEGIEEKLDREDLKDNEVSVPKKELKQEEKIKIKNIWFRKVDDEVLERKIQYIQQRRSLLGKFFIAVFQFIKSVIKFIFNFIKYIFAFALIIWTVPFLIWVIFVTGVIFTDFQFDNQALFSQVDVFLKVWIVWILSSILFLILWIFLKIFKSQNLSNWLMVNWLLGIFIFAFIWWIWFFNTFNEYKNIYSKTEVFEFESMDLKIDNLELFWNSESLIEWLNWIDNINFYESTDEKIRFEVISIINSKSEGDSEKIFSEMNSFDIKLENWIANFWLDNKATFKSVVPYSFLRRELKIYIPKDVKIDFWGNSNNYGNYNTNLYNKYDWEEEYHRVRGSRVCYNSIIEYVEEVEWFACE